MPEKPKAPGPAGLISWRMMTQGQLNFIDSLARQYGPVARFRFGGMQYFVLSHPDHVLRILQENIANYTKETHQYWLLKQIMGNSLLTGDGSLWQQRRRLIQPAFQRRQLEHVAEQTVAATDAVVTRWRTFLESGVEFDVVEELVQLALRVIGQILFSTDLIHEAPAVGAAVSTINAAGAWDWNTLKSFLPILNRPYRQASDRLEELIRSLISQRRDEGALRADLLSALVQARDEETGQPLSDQEIRNEAMTLLLAGHDTTAHHLSWTFLLLARNPGAVAKLHCELSEVLGGRPPTLEDLPRLTYTRMIVEESMRLYPPIWVIPRRAIAGDEASGFQIPAGSYVVLSIYNLQRDPQWWSEPEEFRPERFDRSISAPPRAGAYAPFGWGPRTCVGAQFAMVESQLILARLAQHFTWELAPNHPIVPEGLTTLRPRKGIRIRLADRPGNDTLEKSTSGDAT